MFDLKVINSVLSQLEEEKGIPKEKVIEAIGAALATAYKKEYGKKHQVVKADFDSETGKVEFSQVKKVIDPSQIVDDESEISPEDEDKVHFNEERHILLEDARRIKKNTEIGEELSFPLESKEEYGRISAQTAKQVIIQKIREAERGSVFSEYGKREGEIVTGTVQRFERGNIYIDLGRATGIIPFDEQIPGERYRQGEMIRAYLYSVEESPRGIFVRLSRAHPDFLKKLFENEAPEIASGIVEIKSIAREAGSRSKIAVYSNDETIDPVGSSVGQKGVRVSTVTGELGGEKLDIIEWSPEPAKFIEDSLSPAKVVSVEIEDEEEKRAKVFVSEDQLSLAIGKGGQNVRLAHKLTGWKIDIRSTNPEGSEDVVEADNVDDYYDKGEEYYENSESTETPSSETPESEIPNDGVKKEE